MNATHNWPPPWPPPTLTDNPNEIVKGETRALNGSRLRIYTVVAVTLDAEGGVWRTLPCRGGQGPEPAHVIARDPLVSRPGVTIRQAVAALGVA